MAYVKVIRSSEDHAEALKLVETLWGAAEGSEEGDELVALTLLVEHYENQHFPIGKPDPVEAIKFRMDQMGLKPRDLEAYIGASGRVSEVLNRKRKLSLAMIRRLHNGLKIPYETLLPALD
jgi:HTH-type transcriptional regulator/antitoxin HigA